MKYLLIVLILLVAGCTPKLLESLPKDASFDLFEYHRGGGISSASITAKNGVRVGDSLEVEEVNIKVDYPFFNSQILLKNYTQN